MNDKEFEAQKRRIKALTDKYHRALGFGWYKVDHTYIREMDHDEERQVAKTTVSWQYLMADVAWNMPLVADQTDEQLRSIWFHEYAHILTAPLMQGVDNDNPLASHLIEYTAETTARALEYAVDFTEKPQKTVKKAKKAKKS